MPDYTCPRCGDINRVGSVPAGSTGFRCGGCGGIIALSTGEAATTRPRSPGAQKIPLPEGTRKWWQFWK